MVKAKYRLTPLNILCALLTGCEIVFFAFPETVNHQTYGWQHVYLIPIIIIGLLIDYVLQKCFLNYRRLVIVELCFVILTFIINKI